MPIIDRTWREPTASSETPVHEDETLRLATVGMVKWLATAPLLWSHEMEVS